MCVQNIFGFALSVISTIKEREMRKVLECMKVVQEFTIAELAALAKVKLNVAKEVVKELEEEGIIRKVHLIRAASPPRHYYEVVDKEKLRKKVGKRKRRGKISNPHWYRVKELIEEAEYGRELTEQLIEEIGINLRLAKEYEEMLK